MKTPKRAYKQDVCPECGNVVHWYSGSLATLIDRLMKCKQKGEQHA